MQKILSLSAIRLYLDNPRLSKSESEQEALLKVVEDQKRKLVLLAKDIAKYNLSGLDVIAVFPDEEAGFYRVAEGNRRIAALKLLQNPSLIEKEYASISRDIANIENREALDFEHINVNVFPSESDESLLHFLEIRHLGERGGIGIVKWDAMQQGRFDYRVYGKENLVIFLDDLERKGTLTKEEIEGVTKTNWERILRPIGLEFLHLVKDGGTYKVKDGFEEEFKEKMKLVASALYKKTVGVVYSQSEIEAFFSQMQAQYLGESIPAEDPVVQTSFQKMQPSAAPLFAGVSDAKAVAVFDKPNGSPASQKMPKDIFKDCPTVIPAAFRIQSRNHRITSIIQELKNLPVEDYPNACGCLLRALLELSAKEYLERNQNPRTVNGDATTIEFKDAIFAAKDDLVTKHKLTPDEGRAIKAETEKGGARQLFNGYMHNTEAYPSSKVIKEIFQVYQKFLRECLY
ncbi:MAG: hypothetical protein PHQ50_04620 [Eubacteriales bacterium]|nr:hypothetical protein [Eubacteriales bacterium]